MALCISRTPGQTAKNIREALCRQGCHNWHRGKCVDCNVRRESA